MSDVPQTDVSRPSALPTAKLLQRQSQPTIDQKSNEYLDAIEEEWNKRVDVEIETLVDGMADIVGLAAVRVYLALACLLILNARYGGRWGMWDAGWADRRQGQVPHRAGGVSGAVPRGKHGEPISHTAIGFAPVASATLSLAFYLSRETHSIVEQMLTTASPFRVATHMH